MVESNERNAAASESRPSGSEEAREVEVTDDLDALLDSLPPQLQAQLRQHSARDRLIEVVMDLGRPPEARFEGGEVEALSEAPVSQADLQYCSDRVGMFTGDNRAGIERTLHRISAIRNRSGEIVGLTCRIGRAVFGTIATIRDLVETGRSLLMLGRPGVGKTTALREIARVLADDLGKRVVIIDTSNEIAGDGDIPHPAIGRARRMQVPRPEQQHQVMIEAVENHMPEVIVIDEIGTEPEALAARTIAERGVQLVGTAHGNHLENLIKNPTLSDLIGGIESVTLSDEESKRRGSQKAVLERKAPPTFEIAIEMLERQRWVVHQDVADTVDRLLRGRDPEPQVRALNERGHPVITRELPQQSQAPFGGDPKSDPVPERPTGLRATGRMQPVPQAGTPSRPDFEQLLAQSDPAADGEREPAAGPNGEDTSVCVYPYGISRNQIERVLEVLELPVVLTKDAGSADAVLALRSQVKNHAKIRQIAKNRDLPIYTVKSNSSSQIARALRRLTDADDAQVPESTDLRLFSQSGSDDEIEALEEARLAVEQIVLPKGQPVELLPRSAKIRRMQHELAEHYRLSSDSYGDDPHRRLRIYPA